MDINDWRGPLHHEARQRIVNKIMDTLNGHLPVAGQDRLAELRIRVQRLEERIFAAAISQPDYLRKISLKMLLMETRSRRHTSRSRRRTSRSRVLRVIPGIRRIRP